MRALTICLALSLAATPALALAQHEHHGMQDGDQPATPMEAPMPPEHDDHHPPSVSEDATAIDGPVHAADAIFGREAMDRARDVLLAEHGAMTSARLLIDRFEARVHEGRDGYLWDGQFRWGSDQDRLWLKSEGEGQFGGKADEAEMQALWSHALDPWFDVQMGVRHDFRSGPDRTHAVIGVQGLAPYWFEIDVALFLSDKGDVTARAEGEYDLRITRKLVLQPRAELNFAFQDIAPLGIGSGFSTASAGVRLRYEMAPRFAPYAGVEWERSLGNTRRFARSNGQDAGGWSAVFGVRAWF